MSLPVYDRVWRLSRQQGGALLVLLALADHADDDGFCYPSVITLARMARITERHCRRVLAELIGSGELAVIEAGGGARSNRYQVNPAASPLTPAPPLSPDASVRGALTPMSPPPPDTHDRGGMTPASGAGRPPLTPVSGGGGSSCQGGPDTGGRGALTPTSAEPSIQSSIQSSVQPSPPPAASIPLPPPAKAGGRKRSRADHEEFATAGSLVPVPEPLRAAGFVAAWESLCRHRVQLWRMNGTAWTADAARSILAKCLTHGAAASVEAIGRTVESGKWAGVFFEQRTGPAGRQPAARRPARNYPPAPAQPTLENPFTESRRNRERLQRERDGDPPPGWNDGDGQGGEAPAL